MHGIFGDVGDTESRHPSQFGHGHLRSTVKTSRASYEAAVRLLEEETIRSVALRMAGQPAARVHAVLTARLAGRLPGIEFDRRHLAEVAAGISRRTSPSGR
jgi:hypothetical protein